MMNFNQTISPKRRPNHNISLKEQQRVQLEKGLDQLKFNLKYFSGI
jgi:hypothetical protein